MLTILLIILLGGGGGYYAHGRYGAPREWAACSARCWSSSLFSG